MSTLSKEELNSIGLRDPLSWGILNIDLLDGKQWELNTRKWSIDIYKSINPWEIEKYPGDYARKMSVMKPTQVGMSTMGQVKMLHFVTNWPVRVMYTLPRQADVIDFSTTRLDPTIEASPLLRKLKGMPDSVHAKRVGDSYIYITEMTTEPRMIPCSALYIDEVDLSDPNNVSTALNRLDASQWKLSYFFSTPTVPGYGINGLYLDSDMRKWLVKCPRCNHSQVLDWETNLRIVGAHNNPKRVYYGCGKCGEELTLEHIQTGQWVAEKPEKSSTHIGFHISQMMTHPAPVLYSRFRDPQTKLVEFYRKSLGVPYELGGGSLERDDILVSCFDEPFDPEDAPDKKSTYYLGADQGNEIQVVIAKEEENSSRLKIVHIEIIPLEKGFKRLAQLIKLFRIRRAVVDANPNRHEAIKLTKEFPGRVLISDYTEQKSMYSVKSEKDENYLSRAYISRTIAMDSLIETIKKGQWALFGAPPALHPDIELLIDHATALRRDIEIRKTTSGERQAAVYRKLRADHLAHSWLYTYIARSVSKGRATKMAVIDAAPQTEPEAIDTNRPPEDTIKGIVSLLAEVPTDQLEDYVVNKDSDGYELPFPLSYKLGKAQGVYDQEDIDWVIDDIISQL